MFDAIQKNIKNLEVCDTDMKVVKLPSVHTAIDPLHMTSKWPPSGTTSKIRRSTECVIDENSIVYEHTFFYFLFYVYKL